MDLQTPTVSLEMYEHGVLFFFFTVYLLFMLGTLRPAFQHSLLVVQAGTPRKGDGFRWLLLTNQPLFVCKIWVHHIFPMAT